MVAILKQFLVRIKQVLALLLRYLLLLKDITQLSPAFQRWCEGRSDAYIPPSDSQDPIIAGSDHTPIDSETQAQEKPVNWKCSLKERLRCVLSVDF